MSVARQSKKTEKWQLVQLDGDFKGEVVEGQFMAENYVEAVSTRWAEVAIPRRTGPHLQWVRGDMDVGTFDARIWNPSPVDFLANKKVDGGIAILRRAVLPDTTLGRPPRFRFVWGVIEYDCVVEAIGDVRFDELWSDGSIKGVTFRLTLLKLYLDLPITPTDPSAPLKLSRYRPMLRGDTYESLALREYDRPDVGIFLRQDATVAFPVAGKIIKLPKASHFATRRRVPKSYALGESTVAANARRTLFDTRGGSVDLPHIVQT